MGYAINHVHIRASDPHASATWYETHFGAKILGRAGSDAGNDHGQHGSRRSGTPQYLFAKRGLTPGPVRRRVEQAGTGALRVRRGRYRLGYGPPWRRPASGWSSPLPRFPEAAAFPTSRVPTTCSSSWSSAGTSALVLLSLFDEVRHPFGDHDSGGVGVRADAVWHYRRVRDPQTLKAVGPSHTGRRQPYRRKPVPSCMWPTHGATYPYSS